MTYSAIWEWIYENFDVNNYLTPEELIYDVEQQFNADGRYFPPESRDLIHERFQYRRVYAEMQRRQDEQKEIAQFIGGGQVYESLSDEILDDLKKPEIMGIDVEEYATTRETVVPPDITRYAKSVTWFSRLSNRFRGFFKRK